MSMSEYEPVLQEMYYEEKDFTFGLILYERNPKCWDLHAAVAKPIVEILGPLIDNVNQHE